MKTIAALLAVAFLACSDDVARSPVDAGADVGDASDAVDVPAIVGEWEGVETSGEFSGGRACGALFSWNGFAVAASIDCIAAPCSIAVDDADFTMECGTRLLSGTVTDDQIESMWTDTSTNDSGTLTLTRR